MTYEDIYKLAESRKHLAGHDYFIMDEVGRLAVEVLRLKELTNSFVCEEATCEVCESKRLDDE